MTPLPLTLTPTTPATTVLPSDPVDRPVTAEHVQKLEDVIIRQRAQLYAVYDLLKTGTASHNADETLLGALAYTLTRLACDREKLTSSATPEDLARSAGISHALTEMSKTLSPFLPEISTT